MITRLIAVLAYVAMIVIIGIIGMRKTKSFKDFFLGGRNVGPWLTAFTYGTAYFSAVLFIVFAREAPPTPPCPPGMEVRSSLARAGHT